MQRAEAKLIRRHRKLKHLDLRQVTRHVRDAGRYNRIGDAGAVMLSGAIKESGVRLSQRCEDHLIELLDLQDNAICDKGVDALYDASGRRFKVYRSSWWLDRLKLKLSCNSVLLGRLAQLEEQLQAE